MDRQSETLPEIHNDHAGKVSDKWSLYLREYEHLLAPYRDRPIRILEIGIQNGGSLEIWNKYFPNAAAIVGCDINEDCRDLHFDSKKISVVVGNADADGVEEEIIGLSPGFDIIIDDGSHRSSDIIRCFARYFPYLNEHGLYVAEDLHCSYWQQFEGGLHNPHSSMSFFKRLADVVNHEHWGFSGARLDVVSNIRQHYAIQLDEDLLASIHSLRFTNSMCAIEKELPSLNVLGKRRVAGQDASVLGEPLRFADLTSVPPNQSANQYNIEPPTCDELKFELERAELEVQQLRNTVSEIENSRTWRFTKPVRKALSLLPGRGA